MKTLGDTSFFRLFDRLLGASNPRLMRTQWEVDGVECQRERHSFSGPAHGFAMETFTLMRPGRQGWRLLVVKEYWWLAGKDTPLKTLQWAKLVSGRRSDAIAWLAERQSSLERRQEDLELGKRGQR